MTYRDVDSEKPEGDEVMGGYSSPTAEAIDIAQAQAAVEAYIQAPEYADLEVSEVMEFEQGFYAIVRERDTGIGAMELLIDRTTGAVGPEMGVNIMWNARYYGMHKGGGWMQGRTNAANTLSGEEALEIAQRWLSTNRPGAVVEKHADPFYGYYTVHTMKDGKIEGMLSVHGTTGQVWYHTEHGGFIQMVEVK
jgi:hypothetical protein